MSLRKLPEAKTFTRPKNFQWDPPSDVLAKWAESPMAAEADDESTISIYDVIGEDLWTGGGFTAKRMAGALRRIGANEVTVNINSPGGDMFEGIAIYNQLAEHPAKVNIRVMGWAASAASIIAMAGDDIEMGLGTFMMVHNAWGVVVGNRHDMREGANLFDEFDSAIADIYEARTGADRAHIESLMDTETFMAPSTAVDEGFADRVGEKVETEPPNDSRMNSITAKRRMDALLARQGLPRAERRRLMQDAAGTQNAAGTVTQNADLDPAALRQLLETLKS
ncbi:MAG: head maturation protease, ClpP-related [Pseudomonadota bacterium]